MVIKSKDSNKIYAVTSFCIVKALNKLTLQSQDQKSPEFCVVFVVFFVLHLTLLNCKLSDLTVKDKYLRKNDSAYSPDNLG